MELNSFLKAFTFKVVDGAERSRALELRKEVYAKDWADAPIGHAAVDHLDGHAYHLIAEDSQGAVVACSRILGPDQRPFDLEGFVDISEFLLPNRSPALVGRLCVRGDCRNVSSKAFLPIGMLKLAHDFARKRGFTDFVMFTFSHLIPLYRSAFFRSVGISFEHPDYRRLAHVMHLDLVDLERQHRNSEQPLARLLLTRDLPNILI